MTAVPGLAVGVEPTGTAGRGPGEGSPGLSRRPPHREPMPGSSGCGRPLLGSRRPARRPRGRRVHAPRLRAGEPCQGGRNGVRLDETVTGRTAAVLRRGNVPALGGQALPFWVASGREGSAPETILHVQCTARYEAEQGLPLPRAGSLRHRPPQTASRRLPAPARAA